MVDVAHRTLAQHIPRTRPQSRFVQSTTACGFPRGPEWSAGQAELSSPRPGGDVRADRPPQAEPHVAGVWWVPRSWSSGYSL